jgi:hypothetical protein
MENTMRYAVMIAAPADAADDLSPEEIAGVIRDYQTLLADPRVVIHGQLQPVETATNVRVVDGKTLVTDGPFADTKEVLGGFAVIDAANLDDVLQFAARIPAASRCGVVEVRPIVER